MDHSTFDETQAAERYALGQLTPDERQLFEEHFLGCAECLERVELAEHLRDGLQRAAVRRAAAAVATGGLLAALSRLRRWQRTALAVAAVLLFAGLPAGLLASRAARLERELGAAREALARRPPEKPVERPPETPAADAERQRLAQELDTERREKTRLGEALERALRPQVNVAVLTLSLERSTASGGEPARLRLAPGVPWVVVSLEPSDPGFPSYRATLRGPGGRPRWQGAGLTPSPEGLLSFSLPRSLLAPGDYTLTIEGLPAGRRPVPAGEFPFRVSDGPSKGEQP
jgi:hypothetical protein